MNVQLWRPGQSVRPRSILRAQHPGGPGSGMDGIDDHRLVRTMVLSFS